MAYSEKLAQRVREGLQTILKVVEKRMFRGITFMVDGKMCISVGDNEIMLRIDPEVYQELLEKDSHATEKSFRTVVMGGREYKGYILIEGEKIKSKKQLEYWMGLALSFNRKAKASRKRAKK
jgi:TfoX/Sxy family transcriptional regulator of competence genes